MGDSESPEKLALVQRVTTAYLRRVLGLGEDDCARMQVELADDAQPLGHLESK
jgi:hypothetical protein